MLRGPSGTEAVLFEDIDAPSAHRLVSVLKQYGEAIDAISLTADFPKLAPYFENVKVWFAEIQSGFGARFSAPGYLDKTEWSVFDTAEEAEAFLAEEQDEVFDEQASERVIITADRVGTQIAKSNKLIKDSLKQLKQCRDTFISLENDLKVQYHDLENAVASSNDPEEFADILDALDGLREQVEMATPYVEGAVEAAASAADVK